MSSVGQTLIHKATTQKKVCRKVKNSTTRAPGGFGVSS